MSTFKNKILLITSGTGSFGHAVLKRFLNSDIGEIRIFSRDEKKQDDMRHELQNDKVKFYIGDVRDSNSVDNVYAFEHTANGDLFVQKALAATLDVLAQALKLLYNSTARIKIKGLFKK